MEIKAIKLISGEELVGEIVGEDEDKITIKNPLAIMLAQTQAGDIQVRFIPFAPYLGAHPTVTFNVKNLTMISEVDTEMKNRYNSVFGGIVTPPKQLIVG